MPIADWRKYENARLKKVLENSRGEGSVSSADVQNWLTNDNVDAKILRGEALSEGEQRALQVRLSKNQVSQKVLAKLQGEPAPNFARSPNATGFAPTAATPPVAPSGVTTDSDRALSIYANSPTYGGSNYTDPSGHAPVVEFWKTKEFKTEIQKAIEDKQIAAGGVVNTVVNGRRIITPAPTPPEGASEMRSERDRKSFIIQSIVDKFTPPVTPKFEAPKQEFIYQNGVAVPFYPESKFEQQMADIAQSVENDPNASWPKKTLTWAMTGLMKFNHWRTQQFFTLGGETEEELIYQDALDGTGKSPTTVGPLFSALFNTGILAFNTVTSVVYGMYYAATKQVNSGINPENIQEFKDAAEKAKIQGKYEDEKMYQGIVAEWEEKYNKIQALPNPVERIVDSFNITKQEWNRFFGTLSTTEYGNAWQSTANLFNVALDKDKSWADLKAAWEEKNKAWAEFKATTPPTRYDSPAVQKAYYDRQAQLMEIAARDERMFAERATELYLSTQDPNATESQKQEAAAAAIQNQILSIQARIRLDPMDSFGAATWVREPERYKEFMNAVALHELQKGAPSSVYEVRQLKEMFANGWTEMSFQMVFDITNLMGVMGEAIGNIPIVQKVMSKVGEAAIATKELAQAGNMGPVVKWAVTRSVTSTAKLMEQTVADTFVRMSKAYGTDIPKLLEETKEIERMAAYIKQFPDQAMEVFEANKAAVRGFEQISFRDFKQLMDASGKGEITGWADIIQEAHQKTADLLAQDMIRSALRSGDVVDDGAMIRRAAVEANNPRNFPLTASIFAETFSKAYTRSHLISRGSHLMDDTVLGMVVKNLRALGASSEAATPGLISESVITETTKRLALGGVDLSKIAKQGALTVASGLEGASKVANFFKGLWTTAVLMTPRWVITNLVDSMGRNVVYGGDMWDDILTLMESTQHHFADEVGFSPMVLGMSLADSSVDITESVPVQLLYRGYKPKFGVFSYISRRYEMLKAAEAGVPSFASLGKEIADELASQVATKEGNVFRTVFNGFKNSVGAVQGGLTDFNTAIEFTLRTRMFHREYFGLLQQLEKSFMSQGMDGLNDASKALATQIWKEAGGNPSKIKALVESLTGKGKKGLLSAFMMPADWDEMLKMAPDQAAAFTYSVQRQTAEFLTSTIKATGKGPTDDAIREFTSDMRTALTDAIQASLSQQQQVKHINNTIDVTQVADIPTMEALKGSFPTFTTENMVDEAIGKLNRTKPFQKAEDVVDNYKLAISNFADITNGEGSSVRIIPQTNGRVNIEIGKELYNQKSTKVYEVVHESTIKAIVNTQPGAIRFLNVGGLGMEGKTKRLEEALRTFLIDPTKALNENEKVFVYLADLFDENPKMYELLRKTGNVMDYSSAYEAYRLAPAHEFAYDLLQDPMDLKAKVVYENDLVNAPSPARRAASVEYRIAWKQANDFIATIPELSNQMQDINKLSSIYHHEYRIFTTEVFPGPRRFSTLDGRGAVWDEWEEYMTQAYVREAELAKQLHDIAKTNPKEAAKVMQETIDNFPETFLKSLGMDVTLDDNKLKVLMLKITKPDGRVVTFLPGSSALAYVQSVLYSPKGLDTVNYVKSLRGLAGTEFRSKAVTILQQTFNVNASQARDWVRLMEVQAENMAKITGGSKDEFLGRFGFEVVNGQWNLKPDGLQTLSNGVIRRATDKAHAGDYILVGIGEGTPESFISALSVPFYDDMRTASEYSLDVAESLNQIDDFIAETTKRPVGRTLSNEQREVFSRLFSSYLSKGVAPNPKLQGMFNRFESYLGNYFKIIRDTDMIENVPDDVYRAMNKIFVRGEMKPPKANTSTIQTIVEEAGIKVDPEDLLKQVNEVPPLSDYRQIAEGLQGTPEELADLEQLIQKLEAETDPDMLAQLQFQFFDKTDNLQGKIPRTKEFGSEPVLDYNGRRALSMAKGMLEKNGIPTEAMTEKQILEECIRLFDAQNVGATTWAKNLISDLRGYKRFESLGDVPPRQLETFLNVKSSVVPELDEAFSVWKARRDFEGFPETALQNIDTLKSHLRSRITGADDLSLKYESMLYDVENFQANFVKALRTKTDEAPIDWDKSLFTQVHKFQMSDGLRSFVRNSTNQVNNYEQALQAVNRLEDYLLNGGWKTPTLSSETATQLTDWANVATESKAQLISTVLGGGEVDGRKVTGAIQKVNDVMLDYSDSNNFDGLMKNIFPFWMFPSRSMPFWMKTLATHPNIVAAYLKIKRLSRTSRYQAGAVTSQGKPLPSLDGYVPIPGTDIWVNPLAPFSSKYVLNFLDMNDSLMYNLTDNDSEESPTGFIAQQLMESGPIFGFTPAPWINSLITSQMGEKNRNAASFAAIPEIPLIPRWMLADVLSKANKVNFFGTGLGDVLYPEASWHDYLVERKILTDALQQMSESSDKEAILEATRTAISEKGDNPLWQQTYKDLTNQEATQAWSSFFTGVYPKEFTDAQADLFALRNEINLMKSTMNHEFQSAVFQMPDDAETAWQQYLDMNSTPEGWMYRLYTDIGYVKNEAGEVVRNPEERAKYVALAIQSEINQQNFYTVRARRQAAFEQRLKSVPVGAPFEVVAKLYDDFYKQLAQDEKTFPFSYNSSFYTNKPSELIEKQIINDYFKLLNSTRPVYGANEDFDAYEQRMREWESRIPSIAPLVMQALQSRPEIQAILSGLRPDQQLNENLFPWLQEMSNAEGLKQWRISNDDVFDALNNAWKTIYWDEYWNTVGPLSGAERDLAEHDFNAMRPAPNEAEMYAWIVMTYGNRFSYDEIIEWMNYGERDVYDVRERILAQKGKEYTMRQDVWDYFSWVGPSKRTALMKRIDEELAKIGGSDKFSFSGWMKYSGEIFVNDPENLAKFLDAIQKAYVNLGIEKPDREYLVEYVQAEAANNQFKQIVQTELGVDYETIMQIQASYYDASDQGRKRKREWVSTYPQEYKLLTEYWNRRTAFGNTAPIWKEYYLWEPNIPEPLQNAMNSKYDPNAPITKTTEATVSYGGTPTYSGSTKPPYTGTGTPNSGSTNPNTKLGNRVYWPLDMKATVGNTLIGEIEALYSGKPLSQSAISFLQGLKARHPEWKSFINKTLEKAALISS